MEEVIGETQEEEEVAEVLEGNSRSLVHESEGEGQKAEVLIGTGEEDRQMIVDRWMIGSNLAREMAETDKAKTPIILGAHLAREA
jgi:hypothetical protein